MLEIDLKIDLEGEAKKKTARAKKAAQDKKATLEVTEADWEKVLQMKTSATDQARLIEVRDAWRRGEILPQAKFSKTEALRMYKRFAEAQRAQKIADLVTHTPANYVLVQDEAALKSLCGYLQHEAIIAVDTETTGLDIFGVDEMVGMSLSLPKANLHYYIPVRHDDGRQLSVQVVIARLRPYLEDPDIKKVLFNAKFDIHVLIKEGVRLKGLAADTMITMWLLSENELSYRLKDLATKYLKEPSDTFEALFGKDCKFNTIPLDVALVYAAKDTDLTWRFYQWQLTHFTTDKLAGVFELYNTIENPLVDVCVNMEQTGFIVDMDFAKDYAVVLSNELKEAEATLWQHFPADMNFNSPQQLQKVLYDDWGLVDVSKKRSTDAETLAKLDDETDHDGIKALLNYRKITKLVGTYVEKLPNEIKNGGRLHGQFKQNGTVTGRFASNNPNLQNIPPLARKLFVAPDGMIILGADFSQIEPRVLAHITGDAHLREPYISGQDLYSTLASRVFKKPLEDCGDGSKYRKMMKVGLLAVMYGTSIFTLAKQLKISVEEAEQFIEDFFATYPEVGAWIASIHEDVKKNEYVVTMYGRKRRFPGHKQEAIVYDKLAKQICDKLGTKKVPSNIWAYKEELPYNLKRQFQDVKGSVERVRRMAVNAIIQGSAADIMKMALVAVDRLAAEKGWSILATVHDEVLLFVPEKIALDEVDAIENAMTSVVSLSIPLKVDAMITRRWGENEQNKKQWFATA